MQQKILDSLKSVGVTLPVIYLPKSDVDFTKWAVVACDQYTSEPEYWQQVDTLVGDSPSTLRLIYPEVFLEEPDKQDRISRINRTMDQYLADGLVTPLEPGFVYLERTANGRIRKGLIVAVDLETYDFNKGAKTLIRATEGTVLSRIPPRVEIRQNAALELPHIMVLIDDPERSVIEPLSGKTDSLTRIYDFDLMMNGGHLTGYHVANENDLLQIAAALTDLARGDNPLLFAMGDGNHSLATAKTHWENLKKNLSPEEQENHPARFALVELVNVHDEGLVFEPIHRVVFSVDQKALLDRFVEYYSDIFSPARYEIFQSPEESASVVAELREKSDVHVIPFVFPDGFGYVSVERPKFNLPVGTLQNFLDEYKNELGDLKVDYIHGDDVVERLGCEEGNIGFYLPVMDKQELFPTVIKDGALPRKTFSMGEANEKRFYLEARRIK